MSEEFGTVNLKQSESREIDLLRRHYRAHRESLARLASDAPSAHLSSEYMRLIAEIDAALQKLEELEGKRPPTAERKAPINADTNPSIQPGPGTRPLVRPADAATPHAASYVPAGGSDARARVLIIVVAAIVVLAIVGWLIWRASFERKSAPPVVEQQPITTTNAATPPAVTPAPAPVSPLAIVPAATDYGVIRKGTRAVRQFEITNNGTAPVEIAVARSTCRCLFYDYNSKLPPKGKENITVTIDGARAKPGPLQEDVTVQGKKDKTIQASFQVRATIR